MNSKSAQSLLVTDSRGTNTGAAARLAFKDRCACHGCSAASRTHVEPADLPLRCKLRLPCILSPQHPVELAKVSMASYQRTGMQQRQRIAGEERGGRAAGGRRRAGAGGAPPSGSKSPHPLSAAVSASGPGVGLDQAPPRAKQRVQLPGTGGALLVRLSQPGGRGAGQRVSQCAGTAP